MPFFYQIGGELDEKSYGIGLRKNSPYTNELNRYAIVVVVYHMPIVASGQQRWVIFENLTYDMVIDSYYNLYLYFRAILLLQENGVLHKLKTTWWKQKGALNCEVNIL